MSYSTILAIYPGEEIQYLEDLSNSHGSAAFIWDQLCRKYIPSGNWLSNSADVWKLWSNPSIPEHQRAVLGMTFDKVYIAKKDYPRAVKDIRKFLEDFKAENRINHWPRIAEIIESGHDHPGFAMIQTSLGDNPYQGKWNEELEEYGPPEWDKLWSLYDEIDGNKSEVKS